MPGTDPARRDALPAGTSLREYTLESVVGHGGFGIVYRAQHDELGATVAIKEYLPIELVVREGVQVRVRSAAHSRPYQDGLRRFRDEARALMQFQDHPGVVSCRDFFRAHGTAYMVMEFEDGRSLAEVLATREAAGQPFGQADLLGVMVPLLEGLERVHEAGLLHRDIKPANILIRKMDGRPVLLDFGASKQVVANQSKSMAPYTEGYAAMEQVAASGELGTWTDMYGVGAVMWRMVAGGRPPWQPPHPVRVESRSHAFMGDSEDPLPPAAQLGEGRFSPRVVQAIDACLCLQEKRRIQSCRELLGVLRPDVPPVPSKSPGTNATPKWKPPSASPALPSLTQPPHPAPVLGPGQTDPGPLAQLGSHRPSTTGAPERSSPQILRKRHTLDHQSPDSELSEVSSVGRVQTPTLAMLVERELAIREFVPEYYLEVEAEFDAGEGRVYRGTYFKLERGKLQSRLPPDGEQASEIVARAKAARAYLESVKKTDKRMPPPFLYDLAELQRHANRLYGYSAKRTLEIAQTLYERHKAITYPRTDSRRLSAAVASQLPAIAAHVAGQYYERLIAEGTGRRPLGKRYVDDSRVTDHHAIIPTGSGASNVAEDSPEGKILDLVNRRLLQAWHGDHKYSSTTVITRIARGKHADPPGRFPDWMYGRVITRIARGKHADQFLSMGTAVDDIGWKILDIKPEKKGRASEEPKLPGGLHQGLRVKVLLAETVKKRTKPPPRFTEATLLTAMESAGKTLDSKLLSDAMKERGLGTPATRAAIIETLLKRKYIERSKKQLLATDRGIGLVNRKAPSESPAQRSPTPPPTAPKISEIAPKHLRRLLRERFGHDEFRPHQEEVCQAVASGRDLLLVMPTGAGKSLCYQLPGIARGATTLVISPLVALMEDQAEKLQQQGFRAERIHSGRDRLESRRVCQEYLAGELDFLYIAPERLAVPGFPEFLARRTPGLVAIDEAHCISMWGHDFRPEYRRLRERLPTLRPAPVITLTATATSVVQNDIVAQLELIDCKRSIHGFRRDNIEIELVEIEPALRSQILLRVLSDPNRRPAIVYAPTREAAEKQAKALQAEHNAAPYHAGMTGADRVRALSRFLGGDIDVLVATVPCGMGIDKPDVRSVIHTGLPGSIEGYYQEIGRAGRDGLPSKAILLYDWVDREMHESCLDRDYPAPEKLMAVFRALSDKPIAVDDLPNPFGADARQRETGIQKLWLHGGIRIDSEERAICGDDGWLESYQQQREHKVKQLDLVTEFTRSQYCRMLGFVRHFGDLEDSLKPCGRCDTCNEGACIVKRFREPTAQEADILKSVLVFLREQGSQPVGMLFSEIAEPRKMKRANYERLVDAAVRAGLARIQNDSYVNEGQQIEFRRIGLTSDGRATPDPVSLVRVPIEGAELVRAMNQRSAKKAGARRKKGGANGRPAGTQMSLGSVPLREGADELLASGLRSWRKSEAQRRGVPAFMIFNNPTLDALVKAKPTSEAELLGVPGVGAGISKKYGRKLIQIIRSGGS